MKRIAMASLVVLFVGQSAKADTRLPVLPLDADRCAIGFALTGKVMSGCLPPRMPDAPRRSVSGMQGYMVNFGFDTDQLSKDSRGHLDRLSDILNGQLSDLCLLLVGHADSTGSARYNQRLSGERAARVRLYLAGPGLVSAARIKTQAKGESQPLAGVAPTSGRNRRVEVLARPAASGKCG